jgi:hypothetical protein
MESDVQFCEAHKQNLAAEVLRTSGKVRLAARGHSMLPTLWPGDPLTVQATPFEQVGPGDVILYQRWERFFIHRVLRKNSVAGSDRPSLVTRGDSMTGFDAFVLACSTLRRALGLALGYSDRLRSLVLRWRGWRSFCESGVDWAESRLT